MTAIRIPAPARNTWIAGGASLALLLAMVATQTLSEVRFQQVVGGLAILSIIYLSWISDPAWSISGGIAATVFSSRWGELGFPIGLDRVLIVTGLAAVVMRGPAARGRATLRFGLPHALLLLAVLWTIGSAIVAGTARDTRASYGLVDQIGIVPLLLFVAAPVVYRTARQRAILLGTMVTLGAYIGVTAVFETLGLDALIWPRYILDPNVGLHFGRARGPFAQAVGNGIALFACGVCALIALYLWRSRGRWVRYLTGIVALLCFGSLLFTLTRSIWLASAVAALAVLLGFKELRRFAVPAIISAAIVVGAALAFVPGLSGAAEARSSNQLPIWDRYNLNSAALNMIEERPLVGFGWGTFAEQSIPYFRQGDEYPLRGAGNLAHNTYLSNGAEIGLIGTTLWLGAILLVMGQVLGRRGPPEALPWRIGFLAVAVQILIVAGFVLLSYPFPNYILWTLGGIALAVMSDDLDRDPVQAGDEPIDT